MQYKLRNNPHLRSSLPILVILVAGLVLVISHLLMVNSADSAVGINKQLNYQGKLADSGGSAVTDGNYDIKYVIYDSLTGGNCLWTALGACDTSDYQATSTSVVDGIFSVTFGGVGQNSLATSSIDWDDDSLYLGITVASDSEMAPRRRIGSTAYAFNSDTVDGIQATSTANVASYLLSLDSLGNFNLYSGGASSTKATSTWATTTDRLYVEGQIAVATTTPYANTVLAVTGDAVIDGDATTTGALYVTDDLTTAGNLTVGTYADIPISDSTIFLHHFNNTTTPAIAGSPAVSLTTTNLKGIWHFEDGTGTTATDSSGTSNGTINASKVTWTAAGKYGSALDFDGIDNDAATCEANTQLVSAYPFTLCAWIKPDTEQPGSIIFLADKDVASVYYRIFVRDLTGSDSKVTFAMSARNTSERITNSTSELTIGEWAHFCGVFVSNTQRDLYVNGEWEAVNTDSVTYNSAVDRWTVGRNGDSTPAGYFAGIIDEPMVFADGLSAGEISMLYNNRFWGRTYMDGKFGQGYYAFDGNSLSYPTAGNINKDQGTIEMWIRPAIGGGTDSVQRHYFDMETAANTNQILFRRLTGDNLQFVVRDESSNPNHLSYALTDVNFAANTWHHIAATWVGEDPTGLYLDGELVDNIVTDEGSTGVLQLPSTMYIGRDATSQSTETLSTIDEFRISDRALTAAEIKRSYLSDFEHFDVAEHFQSSDALEPGDLVVLDTSLGVDYVSRTNIEYNPLSIGVVSTQPGIVLGGANYNPENRVPIALTGRVPIKVSTVNGSISAGDMLTASRIPGHAMSACGGSQPKADAPLEHASGGKATCNYTGVIGMALESFSGENGKIMMLIKHGGMNLDQNYTPLVQGEYFNNIDLTSMSTIQTLTVSDVLYTNKLVVYEKAEFFKGISVVDSDVKIFGGKLIVNSNTAGTATILAGEISVDISFDKEFGSIPKVTASPGIPLTYAVNNISSTGFTISIENPQNQEVDFDWISFATKSSELESIVIESDEELEEDISLEPFDPAQGEEENLEISNLDI